MMIRPPPYILETVRGAGDYDQTDFPQLLIVTGYPSSGKTTRSKQMIEDFSNRIARLSSSNAASKVPRFTLHHITDDFLDIPRSAYAWANSRSGINSSDRQNGASSHLSPSQIKGEKEARAQFSSAIKRHLTPTTIVVADGLNYIKGFRYQLFCEAKAVRTPSCVVHVAAPHDRCREWNATRKRRVQGDATEQESGASDRDLSTSNEGKGRSSDSDVYDDDVLENLLFRYEEPNGMSRWDSPLFTVPSDDLHPPYDAIWAALTGLTSNDTQGNTTASANTTATSSNSRQESHPARDRPSLPGFTVRPNAATVLPRASEQGFLYELDRATSDVIARISQSIAAADADESGVIMVSLKDLDAQGQHQETKLVGEDSADSDEDSDDDLALTLPTPAPSTPQLQRLRRQFIALNRALPVGGTGQKSRIRSAFVQFLKGTWDI